MSTAEDDIHKFEQFLQRRSPGRRTPTNYVCDVRKFLAFTGKDWASVTMHDIDAFVDHERQRGMSPATIKRRAAALKTFFDFLAEETNNLSWPNPVRMKRHAGKQPQSIPRDLRDTDVLRVWQALDSQRDRAWFALMLRAGLRVGEVVSLKLDDLLSPPGNDQPARLRVCGKGRKERVVLLGADAYAVLQAWLDERPASSQPEVFLNQRQGTGLSNSGIEYRLHQAGQHAEVKLTPHRLRHTFARQMTEAGMPLPSLSKLLGHSQITTTQHYAAGADPHLAQAYQQAMSHLTQIPPPRPPEPLPCACPPLPPLTDEPVFQAPDWEAWMPDLPPAIRHAILQYVQRRLPTWKLRRRREQALKVLGEFHRYWRWQMGFRPVQQPQELTLQDLKAYQADPIQAHKVARTVDYTLGLVRSWLQELAEQGLELDPSLARWRPRPRPAALPRHLSEAEAQQLENFVRQRLGSSELTLRLENACYYLLAHCGLRAGECLDLLAADLDLDNRRLIVRQAKGQKDRVVYLSDLAHLALRSYLGSDWLSDAGRILRQSDGRPIQYLWLYERIGALGRAAGVENLTPHRLRHTLATRLLNAGMEITAIQKLLGHDQINTTLIYARIYDQTVEADYRKAMQALERTQMPLSDQPEAVANWPTSFVNVPETLDNSV